ncbi:hypothetical protein [Corynebacterium diphtheriae]|uniref:hypothetical protein n=1 Tax=Corynebacterium diphtheriae TaxID=1717 RepID=UPI001F375E24|nr:hypothetical protein [Corynebacterium diphtheriae]UJL58815.1 hypothetical protein FE378_09120 [Corynebacterium diphtheriae]
MFHDVTLTRNSETLRPERIDDSFRLHSFIDPIMWAGMAARYLVSIPDNGDSRWSRYGLLAL